MSDATELHHALAPAYARLEQVRAIWVDASKKYIEPASFQIALQHLITTSRTVSFVLQKQKANIPNFDDWYERKQLDWRADDVMRWAVNARNTIEKIGDLETYSEVRATLIAGHVLGPESIWVPEQKFGLPIDFLKSIPTKYLSAHVVAHGHLILERRWVANTLPAHELLEAMSHVYAKLASALNEASVNLDGDGAHQVECNPPIMSPLLMDRALYIALNTGEEIGMRTHRVPPDGAGVRRNYGKVFRKLDFGRVASARTLDEVAEAFFRNARIILKHDGYHIPLAVFLRDNEILSIASAEFPNRGSKYLVIRELAHYALSLGATQCVIVSEAWAAEAAKMEPGEFPDTAEGRVEILSLVAADSDGQAFQLTAPMKRSLLNKKKVKKIGLTARNDLKGVSIVAPFQQLWGCLDVGAEPEEVIIGDGAASAAEPDPTP